jgi:2-polyprenyl-6-methoxyphenol hydroxylase-like FAD-dependent oxidoreductase
VTTKLKIGIVGGSIAGCSAAILLLRAGHEVVVYERSTGALVGRGGGIGTPSSVLNALIEQDIIDADFPNFTTTTMPFTGRRSSSDQFGHTPWALPLDLRAFHWSALWNNLRKRVPDDVYRPGQRVVRAEMKDDATVLIQMEDGSEALFDLVLFADGYQSLGRQQLFPDVELSFRGYMLWRGLLPEQEMEDSAPLGTKVPRLSHANLPGHTVMYFIPSDTGSIEAGKRIFNWAAYMPIAEDQLAEFMIDREGKHRIGTIPPGKMRIEEENRLKQLAVANLPTYYGEIVSKTQNTYVQLIYTTDLPAYYRQRICLIGDAGMVIQPFTGSGVFKGYNNVKDLLDSLAANETIEAALQQWGASQLQTAKRLLVLGAQMEKAFIWDALDFAVADAETTASWWKASVTFPEDFSYEKA